MGVISKNKRKLTIYYHSKTSIGKQTLAYVNASKKKILAIDTSKTNVTGTQWAELATKLGKNISDLINTSDPDFVNKFGEDAKKMEEHDWLKVLENNPKLLKYPIVINGEDYIQIKTSGEFKQYLEPDSAGIEKQQLHNQFTDEDKD